MHILGYLHFECFFPSPATWLEDISAAGEPSPATSLFDGRSRELAFRVNVSGLVHALANVK
jgi:hypothetical protein